MENNYFMIRRKGRERITDSLVSSLLRFTRKDVKMYCLFFIALLGMAVSGRAQYFNVPVSGYNADVVADGAAGTTPAASTTADVDGAAAAWVFLSTTYNPGSGICVTGATALPANNLINSLTTVGLTYTLQPYNANNSLRLATTASGTLTLATPVQASNIYLLALGGSGACTISATINFTDLTTQTATGSAPDWCSGGAAATTQFSRIERASTTCSGNPCQYMYDVNLAITPANYGKTIASVTVQNTVVGGAILNVMGVGCKALCATPVAQPTALISAGASTIGTISASFTDASTVPTGYLVVRYPQGTATLTPPSNGVTYTSGQLLGAGTVVTASALTSFVAGGLTGGASYDFYVYSYSTAANCGGPTYLTTAPLTNTFSTTACSSMSGVVQVGPTLPNTPAGGYTSITNALAYINVNGVGGNTFLELLPAYDAATAVGETFPIVLNFNGCINASKTLTIRPASTVAGPMTITTNAASTFELNGTTYVTIDGRPVGSGTSQLSIQNSSGSGVAIKFTNDAQNNTVTYCDIQGQNTTSSASATPSGVIYFSTANANTLLGNDNNTISNCNIHATSGGFPAIGICSFGTGTNATSPNSSNTIINCNIYDFFHATSAETGILLSTGSSEWTITGNSLYQTASRTPTTAATDIGINIANTSGNNFVITNNYIGGTAVSAGGTPWTINGSIANRFRGISFSGGNTIASSIQGNTIANFAFTSNSSATTAGGAWNGIYLLGGNANIGTTTGNTIGSGTGNGSITITLLTNSGGRSTGIFCDATSTVSTIANNTIGSVTISTAINHGFAAINATAATNLTINNNLIGSNTTVNSISANTTYNGTSTQNVYGILNSSGAIIAITNNTISNLNNGYVPTAANTANLLAGIQSSGGMDSIVGNTIKFLTIGANATGTGAASGIVGISLTSTTTNASLVHTVSQNTIYGLSNTNAAANTYVTGIHIAGATTGNNIAARNFIYNLAVNSTSTTATITGINAASGLFTYHNNMIRLGYTADGAASITNPNVIIGFNEVSGTAGSGYYFNSILIGGTNITTGAANTFAFKNAGTNTRTILNNVFVNTRSNITSTGKHYAINLAGTTANPAGLTADYNDLYTNGTGGFLGLYNGIDIGTLTNWQTALGMGYASLNSDPGFTGGGAATADLHITGATPVESSGLPIASINTDFDGGVRSALTPTDIGADAGIFTANDISAPVISNATALASTCSTANPAVVTATITDASGVPAASSGTEPRIYFRRAAPNTTAYFSVPGTLSSGLVTNGVWSFAIDYALLGGIVVGDSINYYITAQDAVSNITANPSAGFAATTVNNITGNPTTPYAYNINYTLAGNYDVGTGKTFPTLSAAVKAYNSACLTGAVTFNLTDNNYSTSETFPINFTKNINADSSKGLRIVPTLVNTVINSTTGAQTININGARYITFEGRIGGIGSTPNLTIQNGLTTGNALQFINDAQNDTINYCTILATNNSATSGMIVFNTTTFTTATSGNSNNVISNCVIDGGAGATASPTASSSANAIYSSGSTTYVNKNNLIHNNSILDYFQAAVASNGILINANSTDWVITSNKFYQTNPRTQTTAASHVGINIGGSGNNYQIRNNVIGYSTSTASGTYIMTSAVATTFKGMNLGLGTTTMSSIQGNTIDGIRMATTASGTTTGSPFMGIYVSTGLVNIGDSTGNTIGSQSGDSTINYSSNSTSASDIIGIAYNGSNALSISNNTIGGVLVSNTNATPGAANFYGIRVSTITAALTCSNNTIGGTVANSIQSQSASTGCIVNGIANVSAIGTFNNNTIRNLSTTGGTGTLLSSAVSGIALSASPNQTITNNIISMLSSSGTAASVAGITITAGTIVNVSGNKISQLSGSGMTTPVVRGIQVSGGTTVNVFKNKVYDLSQSGTTTSAPAVNAMNFSGGTTVSVYNNLIGDLRAPATNSIDAIRGISVTSTTATTTYRLYYNSIFINASSTGGEFGTSGIYHTSNATAATASLDLKNNSIIDLSTPSDTGMIVSFRRSGTALANYASTSNRNQLYAGVPSLNNLIMYDGTNKYQTIATFQAAVIARDLNSFTGESGFSYSSGGSFYQSVTGSSALFLNPVAGITTQCEGGAATITTPVITDDYAGNVRSVTTPDVGAWEFVGITPTPAITLDSIIPSATQCTATNRTVTVHVSTPVGSISSVTLNYTYNSVAQTPVTMINVSGNTWTGDIIAPTSPVNASIGWSVTAVNSIGVNGTYTSVSNYADAPLTGITGTATATFTTTCSGSPTELSVTMSSTTPTAYAWSDGTSTVGTTNPLIVSPATSTTYTCTVTSLGCTLSSSSVAITVNPLPSAPTATPSVQCGVGIPSASVASTSGSATPSFNWYSASTGGTLLQGPPYSALMPFYANDFSTATLTNASITGSASIAGGILSLQPYVVSLQGGFTVNSSGYNSDQYQVDFDMTTGTSLSIADGFSYNFGDDVSASSNIPSAEHGTGSKLRIGFFTYNAASASDGRGIYLMYNCVPLSGYTAATPGVLAYSTNTAFINSTQHMNIVINTAGQLTLTMGATVIFSNVQLPAAFMAADKSTWSHVIKSRSGGVAGTFSLDNIDIKASQPAAGSTTYLSPVNATTTFYVSELSMGCSSTRTPVLATVNTPDALTASSSSLTNVCANTSISLSAAQTGSTNSYALTWTASPVTGSGIATSIGGSLITPTVIIPTAVGTYTYTITGLESGTGCTTTSTVVVGVIDPFNGVVITSGASINPVCAGSPTNLTVTFGSTLPAPTYTTPPAVTFPTTDEDIGEVTITKGATTVLSNITPANSLAGSIGTATGTAGSYSDFTAFGPYYLIPGETYNLSLTSLQPNLPYNNAFNLYIDYNQNGSFSDPGENAYFSPAITNGGHTETGSFTVPMNAKTGLTRMRVLNMEGATVPNSPTVTIGYGEYEEYAMSIIPNVSTYSWSDGSTTVGSTNPLSLIPSAATTYTPTINVLGCTAVGSPILVNVTALPSAPTVLGSSQCGTQVPTASVTSTTGAGSPVFNWYAAATGGAPLQSGTSNTYTTAIGTTTTFHVSESFNGCESARTAVTVTITIPDTIIASSSALANVCVNTPISLSVAQTGSSNVYTLDWTATPATGSGIASSASGSLVTPTIITPTAAGSYTYTVTGVESGTGCTTNSTVVVGVIDPFNGVTVTSSTSSNPVCSSSPTNLSVALTGGSPVLSAFSWSDGSTVVGTSNPLSVSPATTTTYICTVTSSGCIAQSTSITVNTTPLPSAPSASGSIQCGLAIPTATVASTSGNPSPVFNWYSAATGGTLLQGQSFGALTSYYANDFSTATLTNASLAGVASIGAGILTLQTSTLPSQAGGFTVNASGYNSNQYQVDFDMTTGPAASMADGFSYNFGDDVSATTAIPSAEHGTGSKLKIGFFTYNAASGTDGKGIYLMYNCIATTLYTAATPGVLAYSTNTNFVNSTQHINVVINAAGQLTLTVGGTVIFNAVQLPSDFMSTDKSTWAHVIKSRSGGVTGAFSLDNLDIKTNQAIAGSPTYLSPISITTTFHVSELSGGCLSARTPVTVTVTSPNALTASSSALSNVCVNTPITLSVVQTGSSNSYALDWTASPATGSGIATSVSGSLVTPTVVTPTAAGSYDYIITGIESGTGCTTNSTVHVNVIDPFSGITATSAASVNPVCSGSPTSLSIALTGGSAVVSAYSWSDGSTTVGTGNPLSVSPVAATTYSCTLTSSGCTAVSTSITVNATALPSAPSGSGSTQCGTGIPTASVSSTTGAATPTFNWYVAPVGGSLLQTGPSTTYTSSISTTTTFYVSESSAGCHSPRTAVVATVAPSIGGSVTGGTIVCHGNPSALLTLSGYSGTILGWESSVSPFTTWTPISNTTSTYTSGTLTETTEFRATVQNGACPVATASVTTVTVNHTNTWSGTTSTNWGTTSNWGCGRVPVITDDVVIVPAGNQPVIIDAGRVSNNLSIATGAVLTLNNTASYLTIGGVFANNGTIAHTSGEIELAGTVAQNIPAGTYNRLNTNNTAGTSLTGAVAISESLILTNGTITLGANDLTLSGSISSITGASSSRFIVTNGTGSLHIQSIGSTGRTGTISFPVGSSATSYNPVAMANTGTNDEFNVRVYNNVFGTYTGPTGTGAAITTGAVDRTWIINEAVAGGSTASVTLQWNAADELGGFTRGSSYPAFYAGASGWMHALASAAAGSDPYTQTYSGLLAVSYPFSVGSGSTLPVKMINFSGVSDHNNVYLTWTTATEVNNKGFDVERSADGKTFTKVDFVKGAGNSNQLNRYAITDAGAFDKNNVHVLYYRLKQTDFDGKFAYTNAISVSNEANPSGAISASPNPFINELNLSLVAGDHGLADVIITDMQGREIATKTLTYQKGLNVYPVTELNNANNGVYFVKVIMNGESNVVKLTKIY
jgi:hypothetical protein